jgi:hypothetical protein
MMELSQGTSACSHRRSSQISRDKRLATVTCAKEGSREIEVYDFDASTLQYNDTPTFTTSGCDVYSGFGFSGDGKTIVCPTGGLTGCNGKVYNEDSSGVWTHTDMNFFSCGHYSYAPGYFQLGSSYDGTSFAVGGGSFTTPGNANHGHGLVKVFKKNPEGTWVNTYEYVGTAAKGHVGYSAVLSDDGKRLVYNDGSGNPDLSMILKYVEQNDDGSWGNPTVVPTVPNGGYGVKAFFTPDGSRLSVTTDEQGLFVFDYDDTVVGGGWNQVARFQDSRYKGSDGNTIHAISDDGKRMISCGHNFNQIATLDQGDDGTWTESLWGSQMSNAGCTIDGSGGIMIISDANGNLRAYRDETIELVPPTVSPTTSPTTAAVKAKNEYQISLIDDSINVVFNNSRLDKELMMDLNVTTGNVPELSDSIKVYDYESCSDTEYDSSMLTASALKGDAVTDASSDGVFSTVPVAIDLNTTDIASFNNSESNPGFFSARDESVVLQFCLKPTLGSIEVYDAEEGEEVETYISYTKIKVQIELDMTMNFDTATVTIKEDALEESTENVNVDYTLDAYECDAATKVKIDGTPVKSQNSLVTICIESKFDDIVVGGIKELTLTQSSSGLTFKAIDDSETNSITEVSGTGTKKAAVSTRLVGAFFTDLGDDQSEISIEGIAVLGFGYSRRLVRIGNIPGANQQAVERIVEEEKDPLQGEFAVNLAISAKIEDTVSAAVQMKNFFAALFTAAIGALVL